MCIEMPFLILAMGLLFVGFYQPEVNCKIDCNQLKYSKPCSVACEQYKVETPSVFKNKEVKEPIPSNLWYGLTNKYRDISDENTGIYLSLKDDYFVKYMKVNSLYIKNSPWHKYYSNDFKKKMNQLDKYEWYLPAIMPLYMLPVYQQFVDYVLITITENQTKLGKCPINSTTVALHGQNKYYFYLDIDPRGIGIKFFGRLK